MRGMFVQPRTPAQEKLQRYIARHYRRRDIESVQMVDDCRARLVLRNGSIEYLLYTRRAVIRCYFDDEI